MNRLDICDAYYMFAKECRREHGCYWRCVLFRLERMGYKPGKYVQSGRLTKGALKVYEDLRVRETSRVLASIHLARIRLVAD